MDNNICIENGTKIKLIKEMGAFKNVGEVCEVVSVDEDTISFKFGNGMHLGCMSFSELSKYFDIIEDIPNFSVSPEEVCDIIDNGVIEAHQFDNAYSVVFTHENGCVFTSTCSYLDSSESNRRLYDECIEDIKKSISEFESYHRRCVWHEKVKNEESKNHKEYEEDEEDYLL